MENFQIIGSGFECLAETNQKLPNISYSSKHKSHAPVAHTYTPSYLEGSSPALANSSRDFISKITTAKWARGGAQVVECLLCKCKTNQTKTKTPKNMKNIVLTMKM
jgi:hypothetical protein